jgi:hypothetical protein
MITPTAIQGLSRAKGANYAPPRPRNHPLVQAHGQSLSIAHGRGAQELCALAQKNRLAAPAAIAERFPLGAGHYGEGFGNQKASRSLSLDAGND